MHEVCTITGPNGQEYTAGGASVHGKNITGYTAVGRRGLELTTWHEKTMLSGRSEVIETYRPTFNYDGGCVIVWQLRKNRWIIGYALGEKGMLFRGELYTGEDVDEVHEAARNVASYWMAIDADDAERDSVDNGDDAS